MYFLVFCTLFCALMTATSRRETWELLHVEIKCWKWEDVEDFSVLLSRFGHRRTRRLEHDPATSVQVLQFIFSLSLTRWARHSGGERWSHPLLICSWIKLHVLKHILFAWGSIGSMSTKIMDIFQEVSAPPFSPWSRAHICSTSQSINKSATSCDSSTLLLGWSYCVNQSRSPGPERSLGFESPYLFGNHLLVGPDSWIDFFRILPTLSYVLLVDAHGVIIFACYYIMLYEFDTK